MTFSLALDHDTIDKFFTNHFDELEEFPEEPTEKDFDTLDMLESEQDYLESWDNIEEE